MVTIDKPFEAKTHSLGTAGNHPRLHEPVDRGRKVIPYPNHQLRHAFVLGFCTSLCNTQLGGVSKRHVDIDERRRIR